jgi:hypothetical protein
MKLFLLTTALVILMTACGGNNATTNNEELPPTNDEASSSSSESEVVEEIFFTASVTGDREREFADIATLTCTDGNGANIPRHQILTMNDDDTSSTIALSMPALSDTGTYPLVGQTVENYGEAYAIEVFFDRNVAFVIVEEGTLTLDAIAKGPGEPVKGSLQATMTTEEGDETITLNVTFDFVSITTEQMEAVGYEYSFLYCTPES